MLDIFAAAKDIKGEFLHHSAPIEGTKWWR
jgi:hypothetical protein